MNATTLSRGSLREPLEESLSSTSDRDSRSQIIAAIVDLKSPYLFVPYEITGLDPS